MSSSMTAPETIQTDQGEAIIEDCIAKGILSGSKQE